VFLFELVLSRELDFKAVNAKFEHQPLGRRHDIHDHRRMLLFYIAKQ
jgi:hypothetical protein